MTVSRATLTRSSRSTEQDQAAGGRDRRLVLTADRSIRVASVAVRRFPQSNQDYAYLQYKHQSRTVTRYLGNVTAASRAKSLELGWLLAKRSRVLRLDGASWDVPGRDRRAGNRGMAKRHYG